MNSSRRALLFTSLSFTALPWPVFAQAQDLAASTQPTLDHFLALSAQLTGKGVASLNRDMGRAILDALRQQGKLAQLIGLLDDNNANQELAGEVLTAWYCGQLPDASQTTVIGFSQALIWSAARFLHAPGMCGGATGYWAEPPLT